MVVDTLTGRTRHVVRTRWFGKSSVLVLQVEVHEEGYQVDDAYGGGHNVDCKYWRDARLEDLTVKEGK